MKVWELRERLEKMDPDDLIVIQGANKDWYSDIELRNNFIKMHGEFMRPLVLYSQELISAWDSDKYED